MRFVDIVFVYQMEEEKEIRWHSRYHNHESAQYELHYFIQGTGRFLHAGGIHAIEPGTLFFCGPKEKHSIIVSQDSVPLTYYAILFELTESDGELASLAETLHTEHSIYRIKGNYRFYFEDLREKSKTNNVNLLNSAVHQFISFLYLLTETEHDFHYTDSRNVHIEEALRILQSSIFTRITLDRLSAKIGLDKSYFIRLFKAKMGTTPMRYLRRLKLDTAGTMLKTTTVPVYEIADRLKFYSEFHFSKAFKRYYGMSPRSFRNRRDIPVESTPV